VIRQKDLLIGSMSWKIVAEVCWRSIVDNVRLSKRCDGFYLVSESVSSMVDGGRHVNECYFRQHKHSLNVTKTVAGCTQ
jgi:hypothetical protein